MTFCPKSVIYLQPGNHVQFTNARLEHAPLSVVCGDTLQKNIIVIEKTKLDSIQVDLKHGQGAIINKYVGSINLQCQEPVQSKVAAWQP